MKGIPLTYNSDLQEDKPCVFDSADTVRSTLRVFARMISTLTIYGDRMEEMCRSGFLNATDMADYLVTRGMPFRTAHKTVGKIVTHCLNEAVALEALSLDRLRRFSPLFEKDVYKMLRLHKRVNSRRVSGGTARSNVLRAIRKAKKELDM